MKSNSVCKVTVALEGAEADALASWAMENSRSMREFVGQDRAGRELRKEQRRLATLLLEEAIAACLCSGLRHSGFKSAGGGIGWTRAEAPRLEIAVGKCRRVARVDAADYQLKTRN